MFPLATEAPDFATAVLGHMTSLKAIVAPTTLLEFLPPSLNSGDSSTFLRWMSLLTEAALRRCRIDKQRSASRVFLRSSNFVSVTG